MAMETTRISFTTKWRYVGLRRSGESSVSESNICMEKMASNSQFIGEPQPRTEGV